MTIPPEETQGRPIEVTCPGCFHPREWDAAGICPICHYRANAEGRSAALLPVGTQLKGYVIGEKLGQGGFGITYRGFDVTLKMKVAIKEYYPSEFVGRSTDRKTVVLNSRNHEELFHYGLRTFLQEAQTIAQLRHPHLVRVVNFFELNDTAYLVMDYLEGEELTAYLKRQPGKRLPWRQAINLLLPVLDGLQEVHDAGFMHRDLKPGNFFLTGRDRLILLDFGAARQVSSDHASSLLVYSDGYAPYEQYLKDYLTRQGPWTDVYGVAATLYFMLTAQRPPSGLDRKQNTLLNKPDLLKPARYFVPGLPPAFDSLVLSRALAIEPEQRPRSIEKFKQQLEAMLAVEEKRVVETPSTPSFGSIPPPMPDMKPRRPAKPAIKPIQQPRVKPGRLAKPLYGEPRQLMGLNLRAAVIAVTVPALVWGGWWIWFKPPSELPKPPVVAPPESTTPPAPTKPPADTVTPAPVNESPPQQAPVVVEPPMVRIPGGCFQMGSPVSEADRNDDERQHRVPSPLAGSPFVLVDRDDNGRQHRVCVDAFEIGKYEVTQGQWQAVMGSNPSYFGRGDDYPVERVSWDDIQAYLQKLKVRTGRNYRLPTEAEWEYACRGGIAGQRYCGGDGPDQLAWYSDNSGGRTHPVGEKAANGFGLYDMSGNVLEWTCSAYRSPYNGREQECKQGRYADYQINEYTRVEYFAVRGGSWGSGPGWLRSAARSGYGPRDGDDRVGFRLARSL